MLTVTREVLDNADRFKRTGHRFGFMPVGGLGTPYLYVPMRRCRYNHWWFAHGDGFCETCEKIRMDAKES